MASRGSCLAFNVEWFDANASLVRKYRLNYYEDETLDMVSYTMMVRWSQLWWWTERGGPWR